MAGAAPASVDVKTLAKGIGTVKKGPGYSRIIVDGKCLAYVKRATLTVPASLIAKAPKRLGAFQTEANGRWAGVAVKDNGHARRVLEFVAHRREDQ